MSLLRIHGCGFFGWYFEILRVETFIVIDETASTRHHLSGLKTKDQTKFETFLFWEIWSQRQNLSRLRSTHRLTAQHNKPWFGPDHATHPATNTRNSPTQQHNNIATQQHNNKPYNNTNKPRFGLDRAMHPATFFPPELPPRNLYRRRPTQGTVQRNNITT